MTHKWRRFQINNPGLKLLALACAVLSFYAIRGATGFELHYDVPVEVTAEKGVAILEQDVKTVQVTFRGSPGDLQQLEQQQIRAVVRPRSKALEGTERVPVSARHIDGASGVRIIKIRPSSVVLTFDREVEKLVEVARPKINGKPLTGKVELDYQPRFVTLRGPRQRLKDRDSIGTEPVDVEGRVKSFTKQVRVLPPSDTWIASIDPEEITVRVAIFTETKTRRLEGVPVMALSPPGARFSPRLDPQVVAVNLEGRVEALETVSTNALRVFVDCLALGEPGTYELPIEVHLPAGADVTASVTPVTVKVEL